MIAPGLAVPHARLAELDIPMVAMATSTQGIDFGVPEMGPVKVVVMLLTPGDDPGLHLQLLSALAKDFGAGDEIETVAALPTPEAVTSHFSGSGFTIPEFLRVRDVMTRRVTTMLEQDTLQRAIELFATTGEFEIPVIDDDGDLRGVISMARSMMPDSAGSQFFIMHENAAHLDGQYAAFGKVIEGMDVVDEIAAVPTDMRDKPREPQVMQSVTVETFGADYPEPVKAR